MTLVSDNLRCMRIFAGVPWRAASNDSGVIKNINFTGQQIFKIGLLPGKVLVNMIDPFNMCTNIISDSLDHVGI